MAEIVLVHGAWHGAWCWDEVAGTLRERGHTVDAVTLPGHDRSGSPKRIWNRISEYVAEVDRAVDACAEPPILVGHSMGGYTVQRYLERGSARIGVLVASAPRRGVLPANLRLMREKPAAVLTATALLDYHRLVDSSEKVRELFLSPDAPQQVVDDLAGRLQSESAFAIFTMIARPPKPPKVSTPVRVIAAADDAIFTVAEQIDLAAAYDTDAEILAGAHDLMVDASWPRLADALDRIAREV